MILDEPTSGLDPNQLQEIRGLIREIGKEKTVLMSTHIMQEVEAICNRVVIIHKGRIAADDTAESLQRILKSQGIIRVEFGSKVPLSLLRKIPGTDRIIHPGDFKEKRPASDKKKADAELSETWILTSSAGRDIRADVFRFAVENNLTVLSLQFEEQKLEEVFQELTRS